MALKTPHIDMPFRIAGSSVAQMEQNSSQDIEQCVLACLKTKRGSRVDAPEYGIPDPTFGPLTPEVNVDELLTAVEEVEPRVTLISEVEFEEMVERVRIEIEATV